MTGSRDDRVTRILRLGCAALCAVLFIAGEALAAQYKLRVDGMSCKLCVASLQVRLKEDIPGVERVDVDLATGTVLVTTAEGTSIDREAAERAVDGAGFRLLGFEAVPAAATPR